MSLQQGREIFVEEEIMVANEKPYIEDSIVMLEIENSMVTKDLKGVVYVALNDKALREFLSGKYGWNNAVFEDIDWNSHGRSLEKRRYTKWQ